MNTIGTVERRRKSILDMWFQDVTETYPEETTRFLQNKADRFANPVGHALRQGLAGLLDGLIAGAGKEGLASHLDEIVRIRAVQNFSPSAALTFVFALKGIVRRACGTGDSDGERADLNEFDARIDDLALLAFDNYMACRETLFEIKVKELKDMVAIQTRNMWKTAAPRRGGGAPNKEPAGGQ